MLKPMKYGIGVVLSACLGLAVLVGSCSFFTHEELLRIELPSRSAGYLKKSPSGRFSINTSDSTLFIRSETAKHTYRGIPVPVKEASQDVASIKISPGLKGLYSAEFSLLLESGENRELRAYIRQIRNEEVKRVRLAQTSGIENYRIPFQLEKDDTLEFYLKNAEFGFISNPVFCRVKENRGKEFVFIIAADTLRKDRIGAYGGSRRCSPHIDTFSEDAVTFTQAYSTSSWTTPAFMSLATGLFPNRHNVNYGNVQLDESIATLFEPLQERFVTYCLNGDHLVSSDFGFHRGFDVYAENFEDAVANNASLQLFDKARDLVLNEQSGRALFLLHTYQAHNPYNPEIELADEFYEQGFEQYRFDSLRFIKYGRELYKKASAEEKNTIEKIYDAACYTFDHRFGEFISFLKEAGIYENSMILVLSDHGEEFMDHGAWEHGHSLYNELINIPLIVKFPGNRDAGKRINDAVSIVDLLPTVMDYYDVGFSSGQECDGVSLLKTLMAKNDPERFVISYLAPRALRNGIPAKISLVSGQYKYIFNQKMNDDDLAVFVNKPAVLRDEMFDLSRDPGEKQNIADSHPEMAVTFMKFIRGLEFRSGQKGFLEGLKERLKSLGYF